MKRCRTCNRTYTDPNLSYCIEDGTPLTAEVEDDESTVVSPSSTGGRSTDDDWNAAPYRPPTPYVPPGTTPGKPRRAWPWIVGILGAFILGAVGLMVAAAILVPRYMRSLENRPPASINTNANTGTTANTNTTANINTKETPATEDVSETAAPTDEDQVLAQLRDIEHEWTAANLNADKQKLDRILADDYVGPSAQEGRLQGKKEYINTIQRDTDVDRWEFDDLKVHLSGDRATLTGSITYIAKDRKAEFEFKDKFVWRDGRWQATGSEVQRK